jgi:hypothetical protein
MVALRLNSVRIEEQQQPRKSNKRPRRRKSFDSGIGSSIDDDGSTGSNRRNNQFDDWVEHVNGGREIVDDENERLALANLASICRETRGEALRGLERLDEIEKEWKEISDDRKKKNEDERRDPWMTLLTWIRTLWEERVAVATGVLDSLDSS